MGFDGKTRDQLFESLSSTEDGLTSDEAARRRKKHGPNQLVFHRKRSPLIMLLEEFKSMFPMLLLVSAILCFFANTLSPGEGYNFIGLALLGVVVLNAGVSFVQRYKVEQLMQSFQDYIPKQVALMRDGERKVLDAKGIVPGDILLVQEGDRISADGIILSSAELMVDESILTGESEPLEKVEFGTEGQQSCEAYSGSTVMKGTATILVVRTAKKTKMGSISDLSQTIERDLTPMQKELKIFVRKITYLAVALGLVFFLVGFLIGNTFWTNLIFAIGIIVANVPEGLLPTVTLALTQASARMGKRHAVVKNILSVETLGSTTVICSDKTGTLTQNKLHVAGAYLDFTEHSSDKTEELKKRVVAKPLSEIMALCNDVVSATNGAGTQSFKGDPTEVALAEFAMQMLGYDSIRSGFEAVGGQPFSSETKYMYSTYKTADGKYYLTASRPFFCCLLPHPGGRRVGLGGETVGFEHALSASCGRVPSHYYIQPNRKRDGMQDQPAERCPARVQVQLMDYRRCGRGTGVHFRDTLSACGCDPSLFHHGAAASGDMACDRTGTFCDIRDRGNQEVSCQEGGQHTLCLRSKFLLGDLSS